MNLVTDLGNDLAIALFIKKQHNERLDKKEVLALLNKVREELKGLSAKKERTITPQKPSMAMPS